MLQKGLQSRNQKLYAICMKFISDENLGIQIPRFLKSLGYDITSVTEIALSRPDTDVLAIANKENRILITTDKDFGELVFKEKLEQARDRYYFGEGAT